MKAPVMPMTGIEATPTESSWGAIRRHLSHMEPPVQNHRMMARQNLVKRPYALTNERELWIGTFKFEKLMVTSDQSTRQHRKKAASEPNGPEATG